MKRYIILILAFLILLPQINFAVKFSDPIKDKFTGIFYKKNSFGDFYLSLEDIQESAVSEKLKTFVANYIGPNPQKAFIIHLDIENFSFVPSLVEAGFKHHFTDEKHTEWIIRNDSEVPYPLTNISGAMILLIDNGRVLVVEDVTRPNEWGFPGGQVMPGEFAEATAIREAQEEVGFTIDEKDLKFIADIQRIHVSKYNSNQSSKVYMAQKYTGELNIQESEIKQAQWVPIKTLLEEKKFCGLILDEYSKMILQHVANGLQSVGRFELPDLRQLWKVDENKNPKDILYLELIG